MHRLSIPALIEVESSTRTGWYTRVLWAAVAAVVVLSAGCAIVDNVDSTSEDVSVLATGTHVVLKNGLREPIYYFMVGRELSFLIDWIPHLDDDRSVRAGRTVEVRYADIMMSTDPVETQVVVYWWTAETRDGKRVPGDLTTKVVDL